MSGADEKNVLERDDVSRLPDPDDRPWAAVVIYDGSCRLCRGTAEWLDWLDRRGQLAFLPLQDPRVQARYPDLSRKDLQQHVYVIDPRGARRHSAGAVRYLARRLPALWPLAPLLHLPGTMPLWHWLYTQVARRRRAFGRRHE